MTKSKIIKELVNNEVSLTSALKRLYILANDINNDEVKKWVNLELNGYSNDDILPEYRIIKCCELEYSGFNGSYQVKQYPLPKQYLSDKTLKIIGTLKRNEPISEIEEYSKIKSEHLGIDRTELMGEVYKKSYDGVDGIRCTQITQLTPPELFQRIVNTVSNKTLEILLTLEKVYGCLDDLDIGGRINKKEKEALNTSINVIINGNAKLKNSNIGNDNQIVKSSELEISPTVSINQEKKSGVFKRICDFIKGNKK